MSKALVESDAIGSVIAQACALFQERLQRCIENILYITGMICNEKYNIQFSHMRCMQPPKDTRNPSARQSAYVCPRKPRSAAPRVSTYSAKLLGTRLLESKATRPRGLSQQPRANPA